MLRDDPAREGLIGRRSLVTALCALALVAASARARAEALDGVLAVRSAYVNIDHGVFLLHARVEYPEGPAIRNALRDGTTLAFDLEVRIERERRLWFNANIVEVTLHRELSYHAVSDRYVVRDVRSGDQDTFATLDEALGSSARWTAGRSSWSRSSTVATTRSACAPACAAGSCRHRCGRSCSGPTTGRARASGTHGRCRYNAAPRSAARRSTPWRSRSSGGVIAHRRLPAARQERAELRASSHGCSAGSCSSTLGAVAGAHRAGGAQALAAGARLPRARAGLAAHRAHRRHLRRAGDRTAAGRVPLLPRVPQPRHRQLVHRRGTAGAQRRGGAVARRARPAHARVLAAYRGAGARARPARRPPPCRSVLDAAAARRRRARDRAVRRAGARHRREPRQSARGAAGAAAAGSAAPGRPAPPLREPRAAGTAAAT